MCTIPTVVPIAIPTPMPIRCTADALYLLGLAQDEDSRVMAFLLDDRGIGGQLLSFSNIDGPDAVLDIVEAMAMHGEHRPGMVALVVASVRLETGIVPGDIDRWLEACTRCEARGIQLREWYVLGAHGPRCPRDLLGEPPRWPHWIEAS